MKLKIPQITLSKLAQSWKCEESEEEVLGWMSIGGNFMYFLNCQLCKITENLDRRHLTSTPTLQTNEEMTNGNLTNTSVNYNSPNFAFISSCDHLSAENGNFQFPYMLSWLNLFSLLWSLVFYLWLISVCISIDSFLMRFFRILQNAMEYFLPNVLKLMNSF